MLATNDQVYEKVKTVLTEALGLEDEDLRPESTLVGDLGAESIDFLDIVFRLEKSLDIKISRGELFPEDVFTDAASVRDGRVNEQGLAELRRRMPFVNLDEFAQHPLVQDFASMLTVADLCRFVESKLRTAG